MSTALYGVLLLLNTMTGTGVENIFPYLFTAPILYTALTSPLPVSACAFAAMLGLTFMFSGMTTWLIAGSMLLGGLIFGWGFKTKKPFWATVLATFIIQALTSWLTMTVFAALFGFDGEDERELMKWIGNWISWDGLLILSACAYGLLETIGMACLAILMILKIPGLKEQVSFGKMFSLSGYWAWVFVVSLILWYLSHSRVLSFPVVLQDASTFLVLGLGVLMIIAGAREMIRQLAIRKGKPFMASLVMLMCFLPGVQLIPAGIGVYTLIKKSLQFKGK